MADDSVVSFSGTAPPIPRVNTDVVERLEQLLVEARNGQITGFSYGLVKPIGNTTTGWVGNASQHDMLTATTLLQHRLMHSMNEM